MEYHNQFISEGAGQQKNYQKLVSMIMQLSLLKPLEIILSLLSYLLAFDEESQVIQERVQNHYKKEKAARLGKKHYNKYSPREPQNEDKRNKGGSSFWAIVLFVGMMYLMAVVFGGN